MPRYDYDLFTIGAGSGGVRASRFAARFGARVAVAEERHLGGTCVNIGCVPKKLMVYASHFSEDFEDAEGYGWQVGERSFDWATLIRNKNAEISRLNGIYGNLLTGAGVEVFDGRATVVDAHTVEVNGRQVTAENILVATGGMPTRPKDPGRELAIVSDDVFFLEEQPKRVLIVGGGYIAVEFAGIFAGLGSEVTQIYRGPMFLRGFDDDVRETLAGELPKKHVDLRFNTDVGKLEKAEDGAIKATYKDGETAVFDCVLYATGRHPNVEGLGLENAGVELNQRGAVKVDEHFRSSVPSIFAIGDVTDRLQLTPVALAEGMAVAKTLFNDEPTTVDYADIPTAVFSQPPIGTVGLTEEEARARHGEVDIYRSTFTPMKHTMTGRGEKTMMKLIVERSSQRVLGAHMVGIDAGEILQGVGIALKAGATKQHFDATIGIHPTAAEEFVTMREPLPDPERKAAE